MLSTNSIFREIRQNDDAYRFFLSVAAKGETQGGWENERIAALSPDEVLRPKIERHGLDETKHGRLFASLLRKRGLETTDVPLEADYCMQLEKAGIGLSHERLQRDEKLSIEELLAYLVHSRVTEQRASEEVDLLVEIFGEDEEIGPIVRMIADDEVNHLSYCHEELMRLAEAGHAETIRAMLREYALAEIATYRRVGLAFVRRMASILGWSAPKRWLLTLGVHGTWLVERLFTWKRMVKLEPPVRPGAMG